MLFDFILKQTKPDVVKDSMLVRGRQIPLAVIRNHRARRYLLRLRPDGSVRLTIPRRGSVIEGRRFAERNEEWLGRQLEKLPDHPVKPKLSASGQNRPVKSE
jgi:predicted metal-dependent hydrolase